MVQSGFCAFVFLLADAALFVFDFELEEFFFQAFQQHGRRCASGGLHWARKFAGADCARCWSLRGFVVVVFFQRWKSFATGSGGAVGGLLTRGDEDSADEEDCGAAAENPPAIFLQGIGSVNGRAEASAGAALTLRGSASALARLSVFRGRSQRAFSREFECQGLS